MMGHNIIITEPSSNLRALGRNALAGKWKIAIFAYVIYLLCTMLPTAIFDSIFGVNVGDVSSTPYAYDSGAMSADLYSQIYNSSPSYSVLSPIYILLVTGAFTLGITIFFLALFRKQHVGVTDIFLGFERFGKALGLLLFQTLFICLWSLIGVAVIALGGIVAAFTFTGGIVITIIGVIIALVFAVVASIKYSQSFFILSDNPDKSIRECVNESKIMMKGNKTKYFTLTLSFIGWLLLSSIPMGILVGIASLLQLSGVAFVIINTIANLFIAPVSAYMYSSQTGFYEILAGHLIKETEPASSEPQTIPASAEPLASANDEHIAETGSDKEEQKNDIPELVEEVKEPVKAVTINPREILENNDDKEV